MSKKTGRPRKTATKTISFRVTVSEYAEIENKAHLARVKSVGEYIKQKIKGAV